MERNDDVDADSTEHSLPDSSPGVSQSLEVHAGEDEDQGVNL